mmetsp:Transcript_12850/g.28175  ORF Transcript_12850/g.28175 Transcript_12850/m.28175 type:complete len:219 (+) Transcript_12850:2534-3190(+)
MKKVDTASTFSKSTVSTHHSSTKTYRCQRLRLPRVRKEMVCVFQDTLMQKVTRCHGCLVRQSIGRTVERTSFAQAHLMNNCMSFHRKSALIQSPCTNLISLQRCMPSLGRKESRLGSNKSQESYQEKTTSKLSTLLGQYLLLMELGRKWCRDLLLQLNPKDGSTLIPMVESSCRGFVAIINYMAQWIINTTLWNRLQATFIPSTPQYTLKIRLHRSVS